MSWATFVTYYEVALAFFVAIWFGVKYLLERWQRRKDRKLDAYFRDRFKR